MEFLRHTWPAWLYATWVVGTLIWEETVVKQRERRQWLEWDARQRAKEATDPTYNRFAQPLVWDVEVSKNA